MQVKRTAADGFVALKLAGSETAEVRLVPARDETAAAAHVWPRKVGVRYEIDAWDGSFVALTDRDDAFDMRSEVHTYDLQSLMSISYVVFCWKKQNAAHTSIHAS